MPNHVTNRFTVVEGDYDLNLIQDFNDYVPIPEVLIGTEHDNIAFEFEDACRKNSVAALKLKYSTSQEKLNKILKLSDNLEKYGYITWYEWSINNWGTKWNMYDRNYSNGVLTFDTAWNHPKFIYYAIAKTLPDGVVIKAEYASEDLGSEVGIKYLSNKTVLAEGIEKNTTYAYGLALDIKGWKEDFRFINGEWIHIDDLEDGCDE